MRTGAEARLAAWVVLLGSVMLLHGSAASAGNATTWKLGTFAGERDYFVQTQQLYRDKTELETEVRDDLGLEGRTGLDEVVYECEPSFTRFDPKGGPLVRARFSNPEMEVLEFGVMMQYTLQNAKGRSRLTKRLNQESDSRSGGVRYTAKTPATYTHARSSTGTVISLKDLLTISGVATKGLTFSVDYGWKGTAEIGDSQSARCTFRVSF